MQAKLLMTQDSGATGPSKTVEIDDLQHAKEVAFEWSRAQLGHPWDCCLIEIPDMDCSIEMRLSYEGAKMTMREAL